MTYFNGEHIDLHSYINAINCNYCKHIDVTEKERHTGHTCLKHSIRVFHRSNNNKIEHDYIYPCEKCNGDDFKYNIFATYQDIPPTKEEVIMECYKESIDNHNKTKDRL